MKYRRPQWDGVVPSLFAFKVNGHGLDGAPVEEVRAEVFMIKVFAKKDQLGGDLVPLLNSDTDVAADGGVAPRDAHVSEVFKTVFERLEKLNLWVG